MADPTRILHQTDVEDVINVEIDKADVIQDAANDAEFARQGTATIASPTADVASLKAAVDEIRASLTASGVTA